MMNKKLIFIRDDDVYKVDKIFLRICEFLLKEKIPVSYAVIPAKLQKELITYLKRKKGLHPGLVDILQHGWRHINYNPDKNDKYEFGRLRNYLQQKSDFLKGFNKLKEIFNDKFLPCFVPPYHGYDITTLRILEELKIPLFSAGRILTPYRFGFKQLPAAVSLNDYAREGTPLCIPFDAMARRFLYHLNKQSPFLGIVFHHKVIKKDKDLKDIIRFFLLLKKMEQRNHIFLAPLSKLSKTPSIKS